MDHEMDAQFAQYGKGAFDYHHRKANRKKVRRVVRCSGCRGSGRKLWSRGADGLRERCDVCKGTGTETILERS